MTRRALLAHRFGGVWTEIKLKALTEYLQFYQTALKRQNFETWYIDAFAGTGDRHAYLTEGGIFEGKPISRVERILDGSARKALKVDPPFDHYWFAEQHKGRARRLEDLRSHWPHDIQVRNGEANEELLKLFLSPPWSRSATTKKQRGVVFLDPYGLSVDWATLKMLADTRRVDVWYLFPRAAVIHQLARNLAGVDDGKRRALNRIFGTSQWEEGLYSSKPAQMGLFDTSPNVSMGRHAGPDDIAAYARKRLQSLFCYVSEPLPLVIQGNDYFELYCLSNNTSAIDLINRGVRHIMHKYRPASHHRFGHRAGGQ
mgnify:FL=1